MRIAVLLFLYVVVLAYFAWLVFDATMTRFSLKWAARRKLRERHRADKRSAQRRKKNEARAAREREWAEAHPNDSGAKLILAEQDAGMLPPRMISVEEDDFLTGLRREQKMHDDYERRRQAEAIAREMHAARLFDWAIENSAIPEARRHLNEQLEALGQELERADREISHCDMMIQFSSTDDELDRMVYGTRLSEAQAKKDELVKRIARVQAALESKLPSDSEQ